MTLYSKILITGAAGRLGTQLRKSVAPLAETLRLADKDPIADPLPNEEAAIFDLGDEAATLAAVQGCDAIIHMGGAPNERPWQEILDSNIRGSYHIFEGARQHGVRRVIYASSVHAIGYHRLDGHIRGDAPQKPDTLYGVSKCFVESLASLYNDKFGIESACLRIFSSFPEPLDRRMLWSWLSFDDLGRMVIACLTAPHLGATVMAGMSDNTVKPVDMSHAGHVGYIPQDSSEPFRHKIEARFPQEDPAAAATQHIGGWFLDFGHPDEEDTPGPQDP